MQAVLGGVASGVGQRDRVRDRVAIDVHAARGLGVAAQVLERQALDDVGGRAEAAPDDGGLLPHRRVVDDDLHQEAVDLGLGQRIGALGLDRVLGREHDERLRHRIGGAADRDLVLLHDLQQRRLHLGRRAVDLVGEQEVVKDRPELGVEAPGVRPPDPRADQVRGHEIRGELDAPVGPGQRSRQRLDGQRLGQAGHALEQHVAAGQQADEHALEHRVLSDDHPFDLVQHPLQRVAGLPLAADDVCGVVSCRSPCWGQMRRPKKASESPPAAATSDQRAAGEDAC